MVGSILKIINLGKTYPGNLPVEALKGINLEVHQGEILSLLGVNGAGKTTLSSILATLNTATFGDVLFKGKSIYDDIASYRKSLGFCPQVPNLDKYLTVEENLLFAGRYFLMSEDEVVKRTNELLTTFDLIKYRDFAVSALSGGYKQRLLIARSIMHKPEILILDEPTVGLDPSIRRNIWKIIKLLQQQGMTIILTTHYLEESEVLSDRICILSNGQILLTALISELKSKHDMKSLEDVFIALTEQEEYADQ
jgi:ABC-2 type transport system ATP-binding protein